MASCSSRASSSLPVWGPAWVSTVIESWPGSGAGSRGPCTGSVLASTTLASSRILRTCAWTASSGVTQSTQRPDGSMRHAVMSSYTASVRRPSASAVSITTPRSTDATSAGGCSPSSRRQVHACRRNRVSISGRSRRPRNCARACRTSPTCWDARAAWRRAHGVSGSSGITSAQLASVSSPNRLSRTSGWEDAGPRLFLRNQIMAGGT